MSSAKAPVEPQGQISKAWAQSHYENGFASLRLRFNDVQTGIIWYPRHYKAFLRQWKGSTYLWRNPAILIYIMPIHARLRLPSEHPTPRSCKILSALEKCQETCVALALAAKACKPLTAAWWSPSPSLTSSFARARMKSLEKKTTSQRCLDCDWLRYTLGTIFFEKSFALRTSMEEIDDRHERVYYNYCILRIHLWYLWILHSVGNTIKVIIDI